MTIKETIIGVLRHYRQHEVSDENGDGYPLVDALTLEGHSIDMGIREIESIADAKAAAQADYEARILAAIETPDHLALVAAAYRDAVRNILGVTIIVAPDGISHREGAESVRRQLAGFIATLTPADATAALAAIEREAYERGKAEANEIWSRNSRETFEAMCAMRDAINEHVSVPSLESDLLQGPEVSVFCATVAEAVVTVLLTQEEGR